MPRKLRELRSDVRRQGFGIDRETGSHEVWTHPLLPEITVVLAGRDGSDAKPYQEHQVRLALLAVRKVRERNGQ